MKAFSMLCNEKAILVLVPRHPERASKIVREANKLGQDPTLFSENDYQMIYQIQ